MRRSRFIDEVDFDTQSQSRGRQITGVRGTTPHSNCGNGLASGTKPMICQRLRRSSAGTISGCAMKIAVVLVCSLCPNFAVDGIGDPLRVQEIDRIWSAVVRVYENPFSAETAYFIPGIPVISGKASDELGYVFASVLQYYDRSGCLSGFDGRILESAFKAQPFVVGPEGKKRAMVRAVKISEIIKSQYQEDMRRVESSTIKRSDDIPPQARDYLMLFSDGVKTEDIAHDVVKRFCANRDITYKYITREISWEQCKRYTTRSLV